MTGIATDTAGEAMAPVMETAVAAGRTILIADDDKAIRTVLSQALGRAGYEVRTTGTAATLWNWVSDGAGDLVITDVVMPDENGLDLIPRIKKIRPDLRIVVMSAQNTLLTAVKATERGAFEYLPKPFDLSELVSVVRRALSAPKHATPGTTRDAPEEEGLPLIGRSAAMQEIYRTLARLMNTDLTVMITGESGTGKELVARALHDYGKRRAGPFVAVNMAAIPRELIESELFGHEKGAFTGATARGIGRFEQADGGTLFLDEIGDMPPEAQTRLLRVLQENEYTTVGGRIAIRANVRIIAATHRDLTQQIRQGLFREDLFYRLNVVPIRLPSLRERSEDIPELVRHFQAQVSEEGLPGKIVDAQAMDRLKRHRWPGNVRELENLVRRLAALYSQETIGLDVIEAELAAVPPQSETSGNTGEGLGSLVERHLRDYFAAHDETLPPAGLHDRVLREVERPLIQLSLEATKGNQIRAAHLLGVNRNTLRKKIRDLDIQVIRGVG
jgi:two-component system nitrogen regulation response regulator GlnG